MATAERPALLPLNAAGIPAMLREYRQWVNWRLEKKNGRWTKLPIDPQTGALTSTTDRKTWGLFEVALANAQVGSVRGTRVDGIGFVFSSDDPYVGIDIDAIEENPHAAAILQSFPTYQERSPSGKGAHLFIEGLLPIDLNESGKRAGKVEIYQHSRFFTVTGHVLDGAEAEPRNCQIELDALWGRLFPAKESPTTSTSTSGRMTDAEILERATAAKNGLKFRALYHDGDTIEYGGDESAADLALMSILAFWTQDETQLVRLFDGSSLGQRSKWRDRQDYRSRTIKRALERSDTFSSVGTTITVNAGHGARSGRDSDQQEGPSDGDSPSGPEGVPAKVLAPGLAFEPGKRYLEKKTIGGEPIWIDMVNADIWIAEERHLLDGLASRIEFAIGGTLASGESLPDITLPASDFGNLSQWSAAQWGSRVIVAPGTAVAGKLRAAIQHRSALRGVKRTTVHCFTGWIQVAGDWMYLHSGGAISAEGLQSDIVTSLPVNLALVNLPEPVKGKQLASDVAKYVRMMDLAPSRLMAPLIAAVPAAILNPIRTVDFVIYLHGLTGVGKTELASIPQRAFGSEFTARSTIASWTSTVNYIEMLTHAAKDTIAIVDDMHPDGSRYDRDRQRAQQDRLHRAVGNQQGRGRLNSDSTMKPVAHPRGLIIETGEDFTTGNSATARSLALEVKPRDVDFRVLTELQAAGADGAFARVTSAFIQYVAGNWQEVADHYLAEVASVQETLRAQPVAHARNPETIATLLAAVETWLHVLRKLGALSDTAYSALLGRIEEGFDQANQEQAFAITDSDPVSHFLQLVGASLQSGDAHLASTEDNGEPRHSTSLGWRVNMIRTSEGVMPDNRPQGTRIGWIDQRGIFLIPEAALNVVQALGSRQGISIPWSAKTLGKRLMEAGKIRTHEPGRSLQKIRVGDIAQRALHIATQEIVMDLSESEHENVLCFETRGREAS